MSPGGVELKKAFLARFEAEDWMREGREGVVVVLVVFWLALSLLMLALVLFLGLGLVLDDGGGGVWSDMAGVSEDIRSTPEYMS